MSNNQKNSRQERLAKALKENLKKRKDSLKDIKERKT
jgi:hypothetical protein